MEFFDTHCHILPGVDDGADTLEEAMEMIAISYGEGTRSILLTPHYERGKNRYEKESLCKRFEEIADAVTEAYPDLKLYLGSEILWEDGIIDDLKSGRILTLNDTKYVLVEFLYHIGYSELYKAVRTITAVRFRPIIAHVERYRCLFKHIERIEELSGMEVCMQMNLSSVDGGLFNDNAKWCRKLVREGYIRFFGTDAHDTDKRGPYVKRYINRLEQLCGKETLQRIFTENPQKMIANQYM